MGGVGELFAGDGEEEGWEVAHRICAFGAGALSHTGLRFVFEADLSRSDCVD